MQNHHETALRAEQDRAAVLQSDLQARLSSIERKLQEEQQSLQAALDTQAELMTSKTAAEQALAASEVTLCCRSPQLLTMSTRQSKL